MASRIMHYAIASVIADDMGTRERTKFENCLVDATLGCTNANCSWWI